MKTSCRKLRFALGVLLVSLAVFASACENKNGLCDDAACLWFYALNVGALFTPPCPPPLVTLQPGLQTLNTGGSNYSVDFRFPQVDGLNTYRITVNEKAGQNIWLTSYQCFREPGYIYYKGNSLTGQTETFDVLGDNYNIYSYYVFNVLESGGNYEIQFTIPSAPL